MRSADISGRVAVVEERETDNDRVMAVRQTTDRQIDRQHTDGLIDR